MGNIRGLNPHTQYMASEVMKRQKVIIVCSDRRIIRALAAQARKWVDTREASHPDLAIRQLAIHPDSAVLVTEHLLRQNDGIAFLRDLRHQYPQVRRCLLACYSDLTLVVEAIHGGLVDSLVHLPLTRQQFMAAIVRVPPAATATNSVQAA